MQKFFLLFISGILFFFPALYSMGVSLMAIELVVILLCFGYLSGKKIYTSAVYAMMLVLVCIDKFNDLSMDFSASNLGPICYTLAIALVFVNLRNDRMRMVLYMKRVALMAVVVNMAICYLGGAELSKLDRDVSVLLMFYFMLSYYYGNKRIIWLLLLVVLIVEIFILEARTMVLTLGVFLVLDWILKRKQSICLNKLFFCTAVLASVGTIAYAVWIEYLQGSWQNTSVLFTGRGYIWGTALLEIFVKGDIWIFLFGQPSTPANLVHLFEGTFAPGWLKETTEEILKAGHFHNTIIYYVFNTGAVGVILFYSICYKAMKQMSFSRMNYCLFMTIFVTCIFYGRSLTGYYIVSTIFMLSLLVRLPDRLEEHRLPIIHRCTESNDSINNIK